MAFQSVRMSRKGMSLVEMLVAVVLVAAIGGGLAYFYLGRSGDSLKGGIKKPIDKANDVVCRTNLISVRQSIMAARTMETDGKYPRSLAELKELPQEVKVCPVGGEAYVYDPTTGTVHCPHPGHENY